MVKESSESGPSAQLSTRFVLMDKLLNFSKPQFYPLQNGNDNNSTLHLELLQRLYEIMYVKVCNTKPGTELTNVSYLTTNSISMHSTDGLLWDI